MTEEKKYVTFRDLRTASPKSNVPSTSTSTPSISSISSIPTTPPLSHRSKLVAPERDFQRIPNSITRQAIPEGLFRGKSKQVWDYLWSVTRGAIVPIRTIRKSRREIKVGSGLGSMVTVDAALEHLQNVGLITVKPAIGSLDGNEYEIFTPEEASTRYTSISSTPSTSSPTQNLVQLDIPETSISSITQTIDNKDTSGLPNTSFKTNTNDDDEYSELIKILKAVAEELTGKTSHPHERERWAEVGRVIATELKEAASRADAISSVPAFLAEHLRRRLARTERRVKESRRFQPSAPSAEPPPQPMASTDRRLTSEEITEQSRLITELLEGGYTIEQAEAQFSGSFHAEDWQKIRDAALGKSSD